MASQTICGLQPEDEVDSYCLTNDRDLNAHKVLCSQERLKHNTPSGVPDQTFPPLQIAVTMTPAPEGLKPSVYLLIQ